MCSYIDSVWKLMDGLDGHYHNDYPNVASYEFIDGVCHVHMSQYRVINTGQAIWGDTLSRIYDIPITVHHVEVTNASN